MSVEALSRWQFAITTVYHFLFVPLTIGLGALVAGLQTAWVRRGDDTYLRLTKLFGKLFLINFALGVVTGIVQEFQFGMNWSDYSRFVGDIFGAPLALEGLLAFFLESTFLGLWIFGWDRLPKRVHLATIWIASAGTIISAYFILVANSFMQHPVGFTIDPVQQRAELTDFGAVLTNPVVLVTYPHQLFACFMVSGAFMAAVAGWHLRRRTPGTLALTAPDRRAFRTAARIGAVTLIIAGVGVAVSGDLQGKVMTQVQPMKMAAAEGLYHTEDSADLSLITIGSLDGTHEIWSVKIPGLLSWLATGDSEATVQGMTDLQDLYRSTYGPGSYTPIVPVTFWTFRIMIGLGAVSVIGGAAVLWSLRRGRAPAGPLWTAVLVSLPLLPVFANSFGWIFTEMGRQPWLVFGLLQTADGVSPTATVGKLIASLTTFTLLYGVLAFVEVRLLLRTIAAGLPADAEDLAGPVPPSVPPHLRPLTRKITMSLTLLWFLLIAFFWTGYLVLEGFDFGVGMLARFLGRDDDERAGALSTIGPVWDGNEVWVLVAGGATFAAFPEWYATLFSGFYLPLLAILAGLIIRGVALEYRGKSGDLTWRRRWDLAIVVGSFLPALLWGVALANIVRGVPIAADKEFVGSVVDLLNPFALLGGLVTVALFLTHGALFLALRTDGEIRLRSRSVAAAVGRGALVLTALFAGWLGLEHGTVLSWTTTVVAAVALAGALVANHLGAEGWAFAGTSVTIAGVVVTAFASLYPDVLPSTLNPAWSLTVQNASSSPYTLKIMTVAAVIGTPLVLAYQCWTYWVFRQRVQVRRAVVRPVQEAPSTDAPKVDAPAASR